MAYFKAGHEVLNKELGKVLNELNAEVQRWESIALSLTTTCAIVMDTCSTYNYSETWANESTVGAGASVEAS